MIKWLSSKWWAPVNSYGPCFALTLWKLGRTKVELWYAPADYAVQLHTHDNSDGEFLVLFGGPRDIFKVARSGLVDSYQLDGKFRWKWLTVRHNEPHGFSNGITPMIWVVIEKWKPGAKITSVASDFHLT